MSIRSLTQEDPIGLAGGLNLYGFANGDPVTFSDPFGLCPLCQPGVVYQGALWLASTLGLRGAADVGVSTVPVVSTLHDAATLVTGHNYVTDEDVGIGGRIASGIGIVTPAGGGQIRAAGKVIKRVTQDFVNQAIERGIRPGAILDALRNPLKVKPVKLDAQGRPSQQIVGGQATVVQNPETGDLITTWQTSTRTRERLQP